MKIIKMIKITIKQKKKRKNEIIFNKIYFTYE